jgi:hypothetical protein
VIQNIRSLVFRKFDRQKGAKLKTIILTITNPKRSVMTEKEQNLRSGILNELIKQFPDLKPKIAEMTENSFTYELEKHNNYTYYVVRYNFSAEGKLSIDWDNAELTVI